MNGMARCRWAHELGVFDRALKYLLRLQLGKPVRRLNWTLNRESAAGYLAGELPALGPGQGDDHAGECGRKNVPAGGIAEL